MMWLQLSVLNHPYLILSFSCHLGTADLEISMRMELASSSSCCCWPSWNMQLLDTAPSHADKNMHARHLGNVPAANYVITKSVTHFYISLCNATANTAAESCCWRLWNVWQWQCYIMRKNEAHHINHVHVSELRVEIWSNEAIVEWMSP